MVTIVQVYLSIQGASTTEWIRALSIPRNDIERLTLRPLKWLRFATFTVCGAKGHFSTTPGGRRVDYEDVSFDNLADEYYYTPDDIYHFVDYQGFNDECTSSAATRRRSNFRQDICGRDGSCVITGVGREDCDAVHIIPMSKGSNYITYVLQDRSGLYEPLPPSLEGDVDINCIENGMLLRKDIHSKFGHVAIGFLKTPNFAMEPVDVLQVEEDPSPSHIPCNRTTLQYLKPPSGRALPLQWDVQPDWFRDGVRSPPSILLDFMYGVGVVKHWKAEPLKDMLEKQFQGHFKTILENSRYPTPEFEGSSSEVESDDDLTYTPGKKKGERKTFSSDAEAEVLKAMDHVLHLSMLVKGTTPQSMAADLERQHQKKVLHAQEHSYEKVQQWLNPDASVSTCTR